MATQLDLEEQEQLDQLKAFWRKYGSPITWILIVVLASFAAWNGWQWWQREQGAKAGAMFDELAAAVQAGDVDKTVRVFGDLKERFEGAAFVGQGGLLAAELQFDKGRPDDAVKTLEWVAEHGAQSEYRTAARLRLAALLLEQKQYDDALKVLDAATAAPFAALVADRRGDVLRAQGKTDEAKAAYSKAWEGMDAGVEYRRLIEAKLMALGAAPASPAPKVASSEPAR